VENATREKGEKARMSFTVWFTGLPCSGKTTLSRRLHNYLIKLDFQVHLMDGDAIRAQLPRPLSFSKKDRDNHGRRLGLLAQDLNQKGIISIVAAIAPYTETREYNRRTLDNYLEVFCSCPVEVAERRDNRGLYAKARSGKISHFTGISDPYEEPGAPEVVVYTDREDIDTSLAKIIEYLVKRNFIYLRQEPPRKQEAQPRDFSPAS
jgi:adenylylsulfate kinase